MDFSKLEKTIGVKFKDKKLYEQAFTHRSYLNENSEVNAHNERLEFLGDAVIELAVTDFLYKKYPNKPEGELTALRAALVRRHTLGEIGQKLGFNDYLRMSKGESGNTAKARAIILSNAVEAFVGALYLDQDIKTTTDFINKFINPRIKDIVRSAYHIDAKSHFQEIIQERDGITPHYKVEKSFGPDHNRTFEVGVYVGEKLVAKAEGSSKHEAETNAASKALAELEK
ncbi:ribonuclease III [candidate division Kazan bacterium]|uniref:Ribonuclease 3 n=1 Tax=candidate division Kazan bacterium TaxID=2202143 RepID=A0A420ZCR5_UNCK3|nr:MAG: ribonuclease III [candidate division Kazan bacterium]